MSAIRRCELPQDALLNRYSGSAGYADCYAADVTRIVSHAEFVEAFYTSPVFKLERFFLRQLASRPSTDAQARQLAQGEADTFAAWSVEDHAPNQLLLRDFTGRTMSWLMVCPTGNGPAAGTLLYFGSAVVPVGRNGTGRGNLGWTFRALLGFHILYSRVLLGAARSSLLR